MKLNNKGWGLSFLIVVGALFLLILIFVSLRIRSMTHQTKDSDKNNKTNESTTIDGGLYESLELVLKRAGESYTVDNASQIDNISDHLIVTFYDLKVRGYIESLADPNGAGNCDGYVFIKNDYSVQSFIKCANYETTNYSLWVD